MIVIPTIRIQTSSMRQHNIITINLGEELLLIVSGIIIKSRLPWHTPQCSQIIRQKFVRKYLGHGTFPLTPTLHFDWKNVARGMMCEFVWVGKWSDVWLVWSVTMVDTGHCHHGLCRHRGTQTNNNICPALTMFSRMTAHIPSPCWLNTFHNDWRLLEISFLKKLQQFII